MNLRQILVAYELDAIREGDLIDWAAEQLALDLFADIPAVAYLASLDRQQHDEIRTTLHQVHAAADPTFTVRSGEGEAIARNLLSGMEAKYLAGQVRAYELCRLVAPIEDAYAFPPWLGNLYDLCDWIEPETSADQVPHLAPEVAKMRAADEERIWIEFETWFTSVLSPAITAAITHVYLFLHETTTSFGIHIIGSEGALPESGPVSPAFTTGEDAFHIDRLFVGDAWEHALLLATTFARRYITQGAAGNLLSARVVEIGFVDGDIHRIWPEPAA